MIKYSLTCKDCDLNFESWFGSSKEYEKLKRKKLLNCHSCNSLKVAGTTGKYRCRLNSDAESKYYCGIGNPTDDHYDCE